MAKRAANSNYKLLKCKSLSDIVGPAGKIPRACRSGSTPSSRSAGRTRRATPFPPTRSWRTARIGAGAARRRRRADRERRSLGRPDRGADPRLGPRRGGVGSTTACYGAIPQGRASGATSTWKCKRPSRTPPGWTCPCAPPPSTQADTTPRWPTNSAARASPAASGDQGPRRARHPRVATPSDAHEQRQDPALHRWCGRGEGRHLRPPKNCPSPAPVRSTSPNASTPTISAS